jgi:hypothetical protein
MKNNKGNIVMNHFIIYVNNGIFFQSYDSIIAFKSNEGKIFLDENDWNYSRTTGKYRNNFLNEGIEETRDKIKKGIYNLTNLN